MTMSKLWLVAALALSVYALVFVLPGASDGFLVLRNAATQPDEIWQVVRDQLTPTLMVQAGLVGWLNIYLHTFALRVRWDHLISVVIFLWGSMLLPLVFFGEFYVDYFGGEGDWSMVRWLTVFSIPLIPFAFVLTIVRDVLAARRVYSSRGAHPHVVSYSMNAEDARAAER